MRIRRATAGDADGMVDLANRLRPDLTKDTSAEGFLFGSDVDGYHLRIEAGLSWVLDDGQVRGFATGFDDDVFRSSELWQLHTQATWNEDVADFMDDRIGFLDQFAVSPGTTSRRWAGVLGYVLLSDLLSRQVEHVVTATVTSPVENLAAVSSIERVGGRPVGSITENLEEVGTIQSTIWLIEPAEVLRREKHPAGKAERWVRGEVAKALSVTSN